MRSLALVCAGLALFSSTVAVMLWRDLRAQDDLVADLRHSLAAAETRAQAVPPAAAMVVPAVTNAPRVADQATASVSGSATAAPAPAPAALASINTILSEQREMLKDPEYRKARLAQIRLTLAGNYPGLIEEMGLSPEAADRLFDLLAENQLESTSSSALLVGANGQVDSAQMQEMQRLRTKLESDITDMLGTDGLAKWKDYDRTRAPRMQAVSLGRTLESAGQPLTETQTRSLVRVMVSEQARMQQERQAMMRPVNPGDPQSLLRMQEENLKLQEESNRRVLDAAAGHLTSRQIEALRTNFEQQMALNRASFRVRQQSQQSGP